MRVRSGGGTSPGSATSVSCRPSEPAGSCVGGAPDGNPTTAQLSCRYARPPARNDAAPPQQPVGLFPRSAASVRSRIEAVLEERMMVTAFQPLRDLSKGEVVGAQALTRFLGDTDGQPAD